MPRNNQTGPMGNGPMTGRMMGFCNVTGPANERRVRTVEDFGRARGRQRGFRRGFGSGSRGISGRRLFRHRSSGNRGAVYQDTAEEIEILKMQAESLQSDLDSINRRMAELDQAND